MGNVWIENSFMDFCIGDFVSPTCNFSIEVKWTFVLHMYTESYILVFLCISRQFWLAQNYSNFNFSEW